jgi:hypothetical protein
MQTSTHVNIYPGWNSHSMRITLPEILQYGQYQQYGQARVALIELEAASLPELRNLFLQSSPDYELIAKHYSLPAGLDNHFWDTYWQGVIEKAEDSINELAEEDRERALTLQHRPLKWRYEQGRILLVRLGALSDQKQTHRTGNIAPANRGVWAFPYPHFDIFFAWHNIEKSMPKRLQRENPPAEEASAEEWSDWHHQRDEWADKHAPKPKRFWYSGDIYARFDLQGNIHYDSWTKMTTAQFYRLQNKVAPRVRELGDHLEVFIPGKERGRT